MEGNHTPEGGQAQSLMISVSYAMVRKILVGELWERMTHPCTSLAILLTLSFPSCPNTTACPWPTAP